MSPRGGLPRTLACVLGAAAVCGLEACSRDEGLRCEEPGEYATSTSSPPLRVPDDLSPPREDDALRVPPAGRDDEEAAETGCLERPPDYLEDGAEQSAEE